MKKLVLMLVIGLMSFAISAEMYAQSEPVPMQTTCWFQCGQVYAFWMDWCFTNLPDYPPQDCENFGAAAYYECIGANGCGAMSAQQQAAGLDAARRSYRSKGRLSHHAGKEIALYMKLA
jgi:hypothetical protein